MTVEPKVGEMRNMTGIELLTCPDGICHDEGESASPEAPQTTS
jgi:hypothetical protein